MGATKNPQAPQQAAKRKDGIPWVRLVQFHREIAKRAERGLFAFNPSDDQGDRWSSLDGFDGKNLAGPWKVPADKIRSKPFRQSLKAGEFQSLFIGGPCHVGSERAMTGKWYDRWQPILYREVSAHFDGKEVEIVPASGVWAASPLFIATVGRREAFPLSELDGLAARIVEKAAAYEDEENPVSRAIEAILPELRETLARPFSARPPVVPTPWVLFAPTKTFSPLVKYLISDYDALEKALSAQDADLGGLQILEGEAWDPPTEVVPVMPLIPLNDSQSRAVQAMLSGDRLTVISGPPGCGKSQIVVSLLLNAWARGESVLFASNNNKAVDVVRERLERFESELPIAVRAGNRETNRVEETLQRVLNAAKRPLSSENHAVEAERERLIKKQKVLRAALETRVPQRTNESVRAALRLQSEYQAAVAKSAERAEQFDNLINGVGLRNPSPEKCRRAMEDTNTWLAALGPARSSSEDDARKIAELTHSISLKRRERDIALTESGLKPRAEDDFSWLMGGSQSLTRWAEETIVMLRRPLEEDLREPEWLAAWERWSDEKSAAEWEKKAGDLARTIRQFSAENKATAAEMRRQREGIAAVLAKLKGTGVPQEVDIPEDVISLWLTTFTEYATFERGWLDFIPWSRQARLQRSLLKLESRLYSSIPLAVWNFIGARDNQGRQKLGAVLEKCRDWFRARRELAELDKKQAEITAQFQKLRAGLAQLMPDLVPASDELADWAAAGETLGDLARVAGQASVAWAARSKARDVRSKLIQELSQWNLAFRAVPIVEAWRKEAGADFDGLIRQSTSEFTVVHIEKLRSAFYAGTLNRLAASWAKAAQAEGAAVELEGQLRSIPPEAAHRERWFRIKPGNALVEAGDQSVWPEVTQLNAALDAKASIIEKWISWVEHEKEAEDVAAKQIREQALRKLQDALELLKDVGDSKAADALAKTLRNSWEPWPEEALMEAFRVADPAVIKATIEGIDRDLERGSFGDARNRWLQKAKEDKSAQKAVADLKSSFAANRGNLQSIPAETFSRTLGLLPIWITTAQAAQAIPIAPDLFDIVVIDEASQCTLTNLLPLLYRGKRLVVIGDAEQLPAIPTIRVPEEQTLAKHHDVMDYISRFGHATNNVYSVANRVHPMGPAGTVMLTEHYRSHPQIIGFANKHIYQRALTLRQEVPTVAAFGVFKRQVNGRAARTPDGSWKNDEEAASVAQLVKELREQAIGSIGVVTPFRGQKVLITALLDRQGISGEVTVGTAHEFQGDEREVMVFSPVVAPGMEASSAKWVETPHNLVNVALTRAKVALYVTGDFAFLKTQRGILKKLAEYCNDIDLLRKTSAEELLLFSWLLLEGWDPRVHYHVDDLEVDFVLEKPGVRVAVEVDGGQHDRQRAADGARDSLLRSKGYRVVRLPTAMVRNEPFQCLEQIKRAFDGAGKD